MCIVQYTAVLCVKYTVESGTVNVMYCKERQYVCNVQYREAL